MGKLGLQLYTLRTETPKDFLGTLAKVATVGYQGVELSGYFGTSARDLKKALDDNGLEVAGTIAGVQVLEGALECVIEYARIIECPAIVLPGLFGDYVASADSCLKSADSLNRFGGLCKKNGIKFLYHIHGSEFKAMNGKTGMDILLNNTDPQLVNFEIDVYWVEHAGVDSVEFMKKHGDRCPYIHFKDMKDKVSKRDTEVGAGAIDMRGVMREAKKHHAEWFIVEQEAFHDVPPLESVAISLKNLRRLAEEN